MFLPLRTDSPLRTTPWANWALVGANVLIFLVQRQSPAITAAMELNPRDPHLFGYFAYTFAHAGFGHLIGNMLFLYIFGNNVNDKIGNIGYLGFYFAGGVFAGIGHVLLESAPVIGASGAVAAVTGAYLALLPRSHITILYLFLFIGTIEIPSVWFIIFFFLKDFLMSLSSMATDVAHVAHVSGTLFGFFVCLGLLSAHMMPRDQFDVLALIQRWNRRRQYREVVSSGYDPFAYAPPPQRGGGQQLPDPQAMRIQDLRAEISESIAHRNHPHAALQYLALKRIDPKQVLSRQAQYEVATQLASQQAYAEAAEAYEQFLLHYPNFDQIEQVELMLGVIYARYLNQFDRAKELLLRARQAACGAAGRACADGAGADRAADDAGELRLLRLFGLIS